MTEIVSIRKRFIGILFSSQQNILLVVLFVLILFLSLASDFFFTRNNLFNILRQVSLVGIVSIGATFILISGGIDFTLGHTATLAAICVAGIYRAGFNIFVSIFFALLLGSSVGLLNGVLVSKIRMPAFIATLGVMTIIQGSIFAYTLGYPIYPDFPKGFIFLGQGYVGAVPTPVIIMVVVIVISYIFLNHIKFGRYFFAFGGNREAARVSGINVRVVEISSYVIGALLSTIVGIVLAARVAGGLPNSGGFPLAIDAFTATILGGTSLAGGRGSVLGALIGVLLIGVINNGLILFGVPYNIQEIVKGFVILVAIAWNSLILARSRQ